MKSIAKNNLIPVYFVRFVGKEIVNTPRKQDRFLSGVAIDNDGTLLLTDSETKQIKSSPYGAMFCHEMNDQVLAGRIQVDQGFSCLAFPPPVSAEFLRSHFSVKKQKRQTTFIRAGENGRLWGKTVSQLKHFETSSGNVCSLPVRT